MDLTAQATTFHREEWWGTGRTRIKAGEGRLGVPSPPPRPSKPTAPPLSLEEIGDVEVVVAFLVPSGPDVRRLEEVLVLLPLLQERRNGDLFLVVVRDRDALRLPRR